MYCRRTPNSCRKVQWLSGSVPIHVLESLVLVLRMHMGTPKPMRSTTHTFSYELLGQCETSNAVGKIVAAIHHQSPHHISCFGASTSLSLYVHGDCSDL